MNWVAPIKDDETLSEFKECLKQMDEKYYIMFEIGVGAFGVLRRSVLRTSTVARWSKTVGQDLMVVGW